MKGLPVLCVRQENCNSYFFGLGAGLGTVFCAAGALRCSSTLPELGETLSAITASAREVTMNKDAAIVVAFERTVAVPRGPKTV